MLLVRLEHQITVIDGFRSTYRFPPSRWQHIALAQRAHELLRGVEVIRCDLFHREQLKAIVRRVGPDCIVNLCLSAPGECRRGIEEEARQSILDGAAAVVEAALSDPRLRRVVQVSSSMVYGDFERDPQSEGGVAGAEEYLWPVQTRG